MKRDKFNVLIITIGTMLSINLLAELKDPSFLSATNSWSMSTLNKMSLREKIGQLFVATVSQEQVLANMGTMKNPQCSNEYVEFLIESYHVGGILFLGRSTIKDQINLTNHYQCLSTTPLLVLQDLEWGLQMRLNDAIRFPRNIALGAIQNESLIKDLGYEIGNQCKAIGVHINLAPVIDINNNASNPVIGTRSFGENPQRVAKYGVLYMQGLQNAGILACAKHFPGHGDTHQDSHITLPTIDHSFERLKSIELYPFQRLINAGIDAVMPAHLRIPAIDPHAISTVSYPIITELLKQQMRFKGLVITDALNMGALKNAVPGDVELQAFLAGNDLFLCSLDIPKAIDAFEDAINRGIISQKELDACVLKILQAKEYLGLHKKRCVEDIDSTMINTPQTQELKKKLYKESITLVKNNNMLPLKKKQNLCVLQIGGEKDSMFSQVLRKANVGKINYVPAKMTHQNVKKCVNNCAKASTIIVGLFDIEKSARIKNFGITKETLQLINQFKKSNKKVILSLFGNPYSLALFGKEDAIIMAYEDDPDAQHSAAEVILGKAKPTGKLPITASNQFSYGTGLSL